MYIVCQWICLSHISMPYILLRNLGNHLLNWIQFYSLSLTYPLMCPLLVKFCIGIPPVFVVEVFFSSFSYPPFSWPVIVGTYMIYHSMKMNVIIIYGVIRFKKVNTVFNYLLKIGYWCIPNHWNVSTRVYFTQFFMLFKAIIFPLNLIPRILLSAPIIGIGTTAITATISTKMQKKIFFNITYSPI